MEFNPIDLRATILNMAYQGQSVHIGCAFSLVEVCAVLYRSILNLGDKTPLSKDRDYLVMSKGHGVMAQYACMRELGWISENEIQNYFGNGTFLKGLSEANVPGLEVSSGSLGHGLSVGVGLALGCLKKNDNRKIFCIVGDGEMNEGSIWEGILFASHFKLQNFFLIVDENSLQAMGPTKEVMDMGDIGKKLEAFGFTTLNAEGHNQKDLLEKFNQLLALNDGKPKAIVAKTVKGYGISFMANKNTWHYTRLTEETYKEALKELEGKRREK